MATKQITPLHYLIPIFCLIVFGTFGVELLRTAYHAKTSTSWPTIDGNVIKSEWGQRSGKGCHFSLRFEYIYTVENRKYTGDNYRFGGECDKKDVDRITLANPTGAHVLVHYNPDNPYESVISPGDVSTNTLISMLLIPILMSLCVYVIFMFHRTRQKQLSGERQ